MNQSLCSVQGLHSHFHLLRLLDCNLDVVRHTAPDVVALCGRLHQHFTFSLGVAEQTGQEEMFDLCQCSPAADPDNETLTHEDFSESSPHFIKQKHVIILMV